MQDRPRTPRRRFEASSAPTTLTECARRYHAAALALARTFGVPLTPDFIREYHPAISTIYIESSKVGMRLPTAVQLPPLSIEPPVVTTNGQTPPADTAAVAAVAADVPDVPPPPAFIDQAPPPSTIPVDAGLPCGGVAIAALKPAQLVMVISKTARLVHDQGERWIALLGALQSERAQRLARGQRRDREGVKRQG